MFVFTPPTKPASSLHLLLRCSFFPDSTTVLRQLCSADRVFANSMPFDLFSSAAFSHGIEGVFSMIFCELKTLFCSAKHFYYRPRPYTFSRKVHSTSPRAPAAVFNFLENLFHKAHSLETSIFCLRALTLGRSPFPWMFPGFLLFSCLPLFAFSSFASFARRLNTYS